MEQNKKSNPLALLPILVFLIIFIGSGIVMNDFYAMPAIVAFLIALCVAFCQNRKVKFGQKIAEIAKGVGDENIITMCLIFLCAGAFSGAVTAAGGVESTVNLGLSILPSTVAVALLSVNDESQARYFASAPVASISSFVIPGYSIVTLEPL